MGGRRKPDQNQGDLFAARELFPVRERKVDLQPLDLSLKIKTALGKALRESGVSATMIAARVSEITGRNITPEALYSYTAPSKPEHEISLLRFIAFARATRAPWLFDVIVEDEGLIVMEGEHAHFAQLGHMRQERARLDDEIKAIERRMKAHPVEVHGRRRGHP